MPGIHFSAKLSPSPAALGTRYRRAGANVPEVAGEVIRSTGASLIIKTHETIMSVTPVGKNPETKHGRLRDSTTELVTWSGLSLDTVFIQPAKAMRYTFSEGTWSEAGESDFEYAAAVIHGRAGLPMAPTRNRRQAYAGPGFGPRRGPIGPGPINRYDLRAIGLMIGPVNLAMYDAAHVIISRAVLSALR